jgi:tol-pal system protein YbgF
MVGPRRRRKCIPGMIRFASLAVVALACGLWAHSARAQGSATDLLTRLDRLEATVRELTGQVEQLQYRNQQLEQRLQQAAPPVASSPPPRPSPQYSPSPPPPNSPPPAADYSPRSGSPPAVAAGPAPDSGRHDAFNPALSPTAPGVPRTLGTTTATEPPPPSDRAPRVAEAPAAVPAARQPGAPLDLSTLSGPPNGPPAAPSGATTLPAPPPRNPSSTGDVQATLPPGNTPKDEYDLGYGYFMRKDYALAVQTLTDFLHRYPSDRLAPDAQYWLGEALFASQQYRDAAEAFLAVSTKYETTGRAPDALLRLGQSLAALGEKEAACASLGEVMRKYPRASLSVRQGVEREQKRVHC